MTQRRVVLVTGGATGIGKAIVLRFADEGCRLAIVGRSSVDELHALRDELRANGVDAESFLCDLTLPENIPALLKDVTDRFEGVDVIVNNAGLWHRTSIFEDHSLEVVDQMNVNYLATYLIIQGLIGGMRSRGGGNIVNIASGSGVLGQVNAAAYSASKAAVIMLTKTLAPELKGSGIRINCVAPGAVATKINAMVHTPTTPEMEVMRQRVSEMIPSPYGEPFLEPDAIANVVHFLASDLAYGIHGECIVVDQGLVSAAPAF